jgi:hypothetical protein
MRLLGLALVVLGSMVSYLGVAPWIQLQLMPRRRYHYYYVEEGFMVRAISLTTVGVLLIAGGLYLAFAPRRSGRDD